MGSSDSFTNLNSEPTNFFNEILHIICHDFFFHWKTKKKALLGPIINLFSFSTPQTEKKQDRRYSDPKTCND